MLEEIVFVGVIYKSVDVSVLNSTTLTKIPPSWRYFFMAIKYMSFNHKTKCIYRQRLQFLHRYRRLFLRL